VALLVTLATLFVLLGAILDLVVGAAAAIAQLTLGAIRNRMARLATVEAALLAWWTVLVAFLLLTATANGLDMALLTTLRAVIVLLGASVTIVVNTAAALAFLWLGAVRNTVACTTAIETLALFWFFLCPLLPFRLVSRAALFGDVTLLATLLAFLIFLGALLDLVVCTAAAFAQLGRCTICHRVTRFTAIEAALLAGFAGLPFLLRLLLWCGLVA